MVYSINDIANMVEYHLWLPCLLLVSSKAELAPWMARVQDATFFLSEGAAPWVS